MARPARNPLATPTSRRALEARHVPYSIVLASGLALRYRRHKQPYGVWDARLRRDGRNLTERLGAADDLVEANGQSVLSFEHASTRAREWAQQHGGRGEPITVAQALDRYEAKLDQRAGADAGKVQQVRNYTDPDLLDRRVASLVPRDLSDWRDELIAEAILPATANRIQAAFKAALNQAASEHDLSDHAWKKILLGVAETAEDDTDDARNVILGDDIVQAIMVEAYVPHSIDSRIYNEDAKRKAEGEARRWAAAFGLLVEVLAVTGTRFSQAARIKPHQLGFDPPRLVIPTSRKGGKGKKKITETAVPISSGLAKRLAAAAGRERLLVKPNGAAWEKNDYVRPFDYLMERLRAKASKAMLAAIEKALTVASTPEVTIGALRHSSIVHDLLVRDPNPIPIPLIANKHDTSPAMIQRHYARHISEHTDDIFRATMRVNEEELEPV